MRMGTLVLWVDPLVVVGSKSKSDRSRLHVCWCRGRRGEMRLRVVALDDIAVDSGRMGGCQARRVCMHRPFPRLGRWRREKECDLKWRCALWMCLFALHKCLLDG